MAEPVAQQLAKLQLEIQTLQARLQTTAKDLSLVTLIPKWSGNTKSESLHEVLCTVESTAGIGKWFDEDMVRIAALKLTDTARVFFNATPELHDGKITWAEFKAALQHRFRDPRTDQFHFSQLQTAKQMKGESVFADRCRALAQKVTPQVADPAAQRLNNEQTDRMLLASYTSGLTGNPGRQVRYSLPTTLEDAIKIAVTVEQAETHERKDDTFT
jgi:hypothetical protein